MLLAIDIGNTHTVFGLFDGEVLVADFRLATRKDATSDEVAVLLRALLTDAGIERERVQGVVVSSVVPSASHSLATALPQRRRSRTP